MKKNLKLIFLIFLTLSTFIPQTSYSSCTVPVAVENNENSREIPIKELNIILVDKGNNVDFYFSGTIEYSDREPILVLLSDFSDLNISTSEASVFNTLSEITSPKRNIRDIVKKLPSGFDKNLGDLDFSIEDEKKETVIDLSKFSLSPLEGYSEIKNQADFDKIFGKLDSGDENSSENSVDKCPFSEDENSSWICSDLSKKTKEFIKDNFKEHVKKLGKNIIIFKFQESHGKFFFEPFKISGKTSYLKLSLPISNITRTNPDTKLNIFVISNERKVPTNNLIHPIYAKMLESNELSKIEGIIFNETYQPQKVWVSRFEGKLSNISDEVFFFYDSEIGDKPLGTGSMEFSDWVNFPVDLMYFGYLRNFYGQLIVFIILIFIQVKIKNSFFRLICWILQSPFIIYTLAISSKSIIDLMIPVRHAENDFPSRVFEAIPYIFLALIVTTIILYQLVYQIFINKKEKIKLTEDKNAFDDSDSYTTQEEKYSEKKAENAPLVSDEKNTPDSKTEENINEAEDEKKENIKKKKSPQKSKTTKKERKKSEESAEEKNTQKSENKSKKAKKI